MGVLRAQEAIAQPRGAVDRGRLVHAADEELRRALGHWVTRTSGELEALALELERLAGPGAPDDLDALLHEAGRCETLRWKASNSISR